MSLWFTSFADDGVITEDESAELYQRAIIMYSVSNICAIPLIGYLCDRSSSNVVMPLGFAFRAVCGYLFVTVTSPETYYVNVLVILLGVGSSVEGIGTNILFFRGLPSHIRGTMVGATTLCYELSRFVFTLVGGQMFDLIGRSSPFLTMAGFDTLVFIIALAMACTGKIKDK